MDNNEFDNYGVPHFCHWPDCEEQVPPELWGCKKHWFALPQELRNKIWAAYVPGQEVRKDPSDAYLEAFEEAYEWALNHGQNIEA